MEFTELNVKARLAPGAALRFGVPKTQVVADLLTNPWQKLSPESDSWVAGIGTTAHQAMPTSCIVGGKETPFFVKPFEGSYFAEAEFRNSNIAVYRGINTPKMLAMIDMGDITYLLSELLLNIQTLSLRDLRFKLADPRVYTPQEFLVRSVTAIAEIHNKGVVHGDLHLGQMGDQFKSDGGPDIVFFDFETATILEDDIQEKREERSRDEVLFRRLAAFERLAADDLGTYSASLRQAEFPMRKNELLPTIAELYLEKRGNPPGILKRSDLTTLMDTIHRQTRRSQRALS